MTEWHAIDELAAAPGPAVVALGVFDGLHLGHRAVLDAARALAAELGGFAVATTFDPHPRRVLQCDAPPLLLSSLPHLRLLFSRAGIDHLLVLPFTPEFATSEPMAFVGALQRAARPLGGIVTGSDFCFGRRRSGDAAMLASAGAEYGFRAVAVPPVLVDGDRVSSTRVRGAVEAGDFAGCARLLGRPYTVLGTVMRGRQLGRTLGYPTANLHVHNECLPPAGVYAVRVACAAGGFGGVANLGNRPTVEADGQPRLEAHLFGFDGDLYGTDVELEFLHFLRPEQRFPDLEALRGQIAVDAAAARRIAGS